jgi:hypothetical protein
MKSANLDKTVMLLSADWFLPRWSLFGIDVGRSQKAVLQQGFQEVVRYIMLGALEYWLTDFSKERIEKTKSMFYAVLTRAPFPQYALDTIKTLIGESALLELDDRTRWLLVSITQQVDDENLRAESKVPSESLSVVRQLVRRWKQNDLDRGNLCEACLSSQSSWDTYLRNITPDLPAMLADYALGLSTQRKFLSLWHAINTELSHQQRIALFDWYRSAAERLDGIELKLPRVT